ncbi:unnamed protein product [Polarella glacialis]|uniref:Tubulin--tyrosine ligase-like protein 5 n=1 Tax=Polarella glacialis TaxID=89957 RepID=A0A813HG47_POLGL|nr:unnamed protein product [Polarella glacialis]
MGFMPSRWFSLVGLFWLCAYLYLAFKFHEFQSLPDVGLRQTEGTHVLLPVVPAVVPASPGSGAGEGALLSQSGSPAHCALRERAHARIFSQLTVAFPIIGTEPGSIYWKKDKHMGQRDKNFFAVERVYRAEWARQGVTVVDSLNATFIISKQPQKWLELCKNYPNHQVINHFGSMQKLTKKFMLARTMKNFVRTHKHRLHEIQRFVPLTFVLSDRMDCLEFGANVDRQAMWIAKDFFKHNAQGVRLLHEPEARELAASCLQHTAAERKTSSGDSTQVGRTLVQSYLQRPFLVQGRKCDFRVYLYIPVSEPLLAFYAPGWYMKCGHSQFNLTSRDVTNVVTNTKVKGKMREGANYSELVWGPEQLQSYLSEQGFAADWVRTVFAEQLKKKLGLLMEALGPVKGTGYELLGCDLMLDEDLNVWLMEVNNSPEMSASLGGRKAAVEGILRAVVGTQIDLMHFAASGKPREDLSLTDLPSVGELELVYQAPAR